MPVCAGQVLVLRLTCMCLNTVHPSQAVEVCRVLQAALWWVENWSVLPIYWLAMLRIGGLVVYAPAPSILEWAVQSISKGLGFRVF